jgi:hypothetical protein
VEKRVKTPRESEVEIKEEVLNMVNIKGKKMI